MKIMQTQVSFDACVADSRSGAARMEDQDCAFWEFYRRHKQGDDAGRGVTPFQKGMHLCAKLHARNRYFSEITGYH